MNPRITSFLFTEVIVPARSGTVSSESINKPLHMLPSKGKAGWSVQFYELPKLIMRMTLDNGVVALGECYRDHNWDTVVSIAESLIGKSLNELNRYDLPIGLYREYDGFECAIWDAFAKCHSMRLVDLLGGESQKKVKIGAWSSHRELSEIKALVKGFAEKGYDTIKFKSDLEDDIVRQSAYIKEAVPSMNIILDPNQRWENFGETKRVAKQLEAVGNIFCLEDPMPRWMLQDYKSLKEFTSIRIVLHNSLPYIYQGQRIHDIINALSHQACDGFNFNSGCALFQKQNHILEAANMYAWHGSEIDLGILEAMYIHQVAATKNCIWPSDIFGRTIREHDLLKTPIRFEPPYAFIPDSDFGLGIELDEKAIEKYKINERLIK